MSKIKRLFIILLRKSADFFEGKYKVRDVEFRSHGRYSKSMRDVILFLDRREGEYIAIRLSKISDYSTLINELNVICHDLEKKDA